MLKLSAGIRRGEELQQLPAATLCVCVTFCACAFVCVSLLCVAAGPSNLWTRRVIGMQLPGPSHAAPQPLTGSVRAPRLALIHLINSSWRKTLGTMIGLKREKQKKEVEEVCIRLPCCAYAPECASHSSVTRKNPATPVRADPNAPKSMAATSRRRFLLAGQCSGFRSRVESCAQSCGLRQRRGLLLLLLRLRRANERRREEAALPSRSGCAPSTPRDLSVDDKSWRSPPPPRFAPVPNVRQTFYA